MALSTKITEEILPISYKVSTITMSMQIPNSRLNLNNIGRYLEIDDTVLGIKYNYGNSSIIKGKYLTSIYQKSKGKNESKINKKLFYNQVSLIIRHQYNKDKTVVDNIVNVKIFGNGSLHLTGVKDTLEGKNILLIIYKRLIELKQHYSMILLTKDTNNIYLDNSNNIYSVNKDNIGHKKDNTTYIINKKEYYITNIHTDTHKSIKVFLSSKLEAKRTRNILNMNGKIIGFSKINLVKNKSKLYKNNSNIHFDNNFIFYDGVNNSTIIGNISYHYNNETHETNETSETSETSETHETNETSETHETGSIIEYNYNCNPFITEPDKYELDYIENLNINVNTINIYFKLSFELNRQRLFNKLLELKYQSEYTPEKYSGVKLTYKLNKNYQNDGKCLCNRCTCNNITFLIFQSGNIITTGFKSMSDISNVLDIFSMIIDQISNCIIKRKFSAIKYN